MPCPVLVFADMVAVSLLGLPGETVRLDAGSLFSLLAILDAEFVVAIGVSIAGLIVLGFVLRLFFGISLWPSLVAVLWITFGIVLGIALAGLISGSVWVLF